MISDVEARLRSLEYRVSRLKRGMRKIGDLTPALQGAFYASISKDQGDSSDVTPPYIGYKRIVVEENLTLTPIAGASITLTPFGGGPATVGSPWITDSSGVALCYVTVSGNYNFTVTATGYTSNHAGFFAPSATSDTIFLSP